MPKDRYRLYHEERARGGVALTMTAGSAVVAEDSPPAFGNLHAYDDAIVPWIQRLTDGVHEHGAACMIQLTHLGRRSGWSQDDWLPVVAPSPLREPAHRAHPKEAEDWDIERIVGRYADAAERMKAGGMDGIEIQSYGHFFDQFYTPLGNRRKDDFGGALENRLRVPLMVLRAIRERVGPDYIVGLRMAVDEATPGGIDAVAGLEILGRLAADGLLDFVNVIRGVIGSDVELSEVIPLHGMPAAPHLDFAGRVRSETDLAVLHGAKIDEVSTARHAISEGLVDLVSMARAHIADPHIVAKIIEAREEQIRPCVGATYCPRRHLPRRRGTVCTQRRDGPRGDHAPRDLTSSDYPPGGRGWGRASGSRGRQGRRRAGPHRDPARGNAVGGRAGHVGGAQSQAKRPRRHHRLEGR
jgi:2,4-dienoyl-CoA reductase-like NADH-dependent reductase (Old Yellow Enzyme family)